LRGKTSTEALLLVREAAPLGSNVIFKFTTIKNMKIYCKKACKSIHKHHIYKHFPQKAEAALLHPG
jgi:predicted transcriptional regulator